MSEPGETSLDRIFRVITRMKIAASMANIAGEADSGTRVFLAIGYEKADGSGQITARMDLDPFLDDLEKELGGDYG